MSDGYDASTNAGPEASKLSAEPEGAVARFTLKEAGRVVRLLMPALQQHGDWVKRIHTILVCRAPPAPQDIAEDSHLRSELGRFFREEVCNGHVATHPDYDSAAARYRELHALARRLCRAAADDGMIAQSDYEDFADGIVRFDEHMEALIRELWDLLHHTDPLTGIATRLGMLPHLRHEHERARRSGTRCTVCMIDLDRFKQINDRLGHAAGDRVLAAVSAYLQRNLRRYDHVCRYGGEEFVLMLPNTGMDQARPLVERLRHGLAELPILLADGTLVRVTASFGVAPLTPHHSVRESIEHADQAMYAAKAAGRNQVCAWAE